ncbi:unconventional prefoldin RPB5 interactor-like protein isoform X2 [Condylostylus longicornis]|nr:unconventional prefoldin RPB5 interactor-like protein isoform X2 [Condylostylus longicornis]
MVPIGNKALIPGYLTHTNEVFVSHFGKFISKCTSYQAQEICKNRINIADDYLTKLEVERDMFKNNIEIPHIQGAVPGMEMQEIIEEYDEEKEKEWREEHKKRARLEKLKERDVTNKEDKTYENIIMKLEELELLEELETELGELKIEDDDTLKKLMSGELKVEEKPRVSHYRTRDIIDNITSDNQFQENLLSSTDSNLNFQIGKNQKGHYDDEFICVDNIVEDEMSESSSDEDFPEEFIEYKNQAEKIDSYHKKFAFVKEKIKLIETEIDSMKISSMTDLNCKLNKVEARDYLIDYALTLEDQENSYIEVETKNIPYKKNINTTDTSEKKIKKNQRISFILENDVTYIDQNETVENMFTKNRQEFGKDKIVLNPKPEENNLETINFDKNELTILEKVEKNVNHMQETQSYEDFDLVSKILSSNKNAHTLQITFKHSPNIYKYNKNEQCINNVIESPVNFYEMFGEQYPQNLDSIFTTNEEGNEKLKIESDKGLKNKENNLNGFDKKTIHKDETTTTNKSGNEFEIDTTKSQLEKKESSKTETAPTIPTILKNKDAVKRERHFQKTKDEKGNAIPKMILGDVITNPEPEKCHDLSFGNIINTHAPKKRISRFKQSRVSKLP